MTTGNPLTKQKSPWTLMSGDNEPVSIHGRQVHDGTLMAIVAQEPAGWHLSISFRSHNGKFTRLPSWDEQVHAVRALLPHGPAYHMILPPDEHYVALHDTTMHWHELKDYVR